MRHSATVDATVTPPMFSAVPAAVQDHCGAPESGLGCCYSNTKCYGLDDCATYLSGCPFSNDTKKGESLRACLPDSSTFKPATCAASLANPAAVGVLIRGADVTCYESNKVTCNVFSNGTHKYVTASCKPAPAATSAAALNQMLSILIVMVSCQYLAEHRMSTRSTRPLWLVCGAMPAMQAAVTYPPCATIMHAAS